MMLMYFAGLTLNLMTMAGLVLGIGMLVDNSIVIL
jgi:HAE1 family hydrophobic/amphiphilic exporter-1